MKLPKDATIKLGQEIPMLITYTSKSSVKFTFKIILVKPTKVGEYGVLIVGKNKYNSSLTAVKVNVEE